MEEAGGELAAPWLAAGTEPYNSRMRCFLALLSRERESSNKSEEQTDSKPPPVDKYILLHTKKAFDVILNFIRNPDSDPRTRLNPDPHHCKS